MAASDVKEWKAKFDALDTSGDGKVDKNEMVQLLKDVGIPEEDCTIEKAENMISLFDVPVEGGEGEAQGDGELDFEEFSALMKLKLIFDSFDIDGGKTIDDEELTKMAESMGISANKEAALGMIKQVDTSGDDKIDFGEFCVVVAKNSGASKSAKGFNFGGLVKRLKNGGPPLLWKTDGDAATKSDCKVSEGDRVLEHTGDTICTHMVNMRLNSKSDIEFFNLASCLLEFEELHGECYVGVIGSNFFAADNDWKQGLGSSKDKPGMAPWASIHNKEPGNKKCGCRLYLKGREMDSNMMCANFGSGSRVQIDVDTHSQAVEIIVLSKDANGDWQRDGASATIEGIQPEVAIAVALGKEGDKTSRVRIIGSSTEKSSKPDASTNQKTEDEMRGGKVSETAATALSMAK